MTTISARMSWVTTSRAGQLVLFAAVGKYFVLLRLILHAHDNDAWVSKKGALLLLDDVDDFIADTVVQFLFLQLSPIWQCEMHSILFFLQGHHCVLQPAVHFFENAHGVLSFEAARSETRVELSHPSTDRQKFPLLKIPDHKQNSIYSTLLACTASGTLHMPRFQSPVQLCMAVSVFGSMEARSMRGIHTISH